VKVGDKVQFVLYEKQFAGSVLKIHRRKGWKGYARVLTEDDQKIELPVSFLEVVDARVS
jgi:ribosomal 50S subunit-recycling heat shock protein